MKYSVYPMVVNVLPLEILCRESTGREPSAAMTVIEFLRKNILSKLV